MDQISDKRRKGIGWGVVASVALHVAVVAVFFVKLPELPKAAEEETVNVDLVPPPEEKPKEKAPEEKPKEEARKPPAPPPEPAAPPKTEETQAEKSAESKSPLRPARPVFEFGPKDTGPQKSEGNAPVSKGKPSDALPAKPPQTAPQPAEPATEQTAARPVPQDLKLPEVDVTEVHPEKDGPEAKGAEETKTELEPAKPSNETKPQQTQSIDVPNFDDDNLTAAKTLFSQNDPRIRTAIGNLSPTRRVEELCRTELQAQLINSGPKYRLEIVPSPRPRSGTVLDVRRMGFRAGGRWYDVSFRCEVDPDATQVVSFRYAVGDAVPKGEWKSRGFPLD